MNLPTASSPEHRFRPPLLPTIATVVAIALFLTAGHWQQGRMEQKEALRAQFDAASARTPSTLPSEPVDWTAWRYRPVAVQGTFDAARQILIDNKVEDSHAGYHVVTPLVLADGRTVLVNRGWTPQGASRAALPQVAPPAGPVTIRGRVAIPATGVFELSKDTTSGPVWQNLDPARFSATTGVAVLPVMIEALAPPSPPVPDDGLVRDWPAPDFGIEKHRIYMVQWYLFAALAIVLWVILNLRPAKRASHE